MGHLKKVMFIIQLTATGATFIKHLEWFCEFCLLCPRLALANLQGEVMSLGSSSCPSILVEEFAGLAKGLLAEALVTSSSWANILYALLVEHKPSRGYLLANNIMAIPCKWQDRSMHKSLHSFLTEQINNFACVPRFFFLESAKC